MNGAAAGHGVWQRTARLSLLFLATGLATSRLSLLAHELGGHGGGAALVGARVDTFQLSWFGGGWIRYQRASAFSTGEALWVSLAGLVAQIAVAGLALLLSRRWSASSPWRLLLVAMAGLTSVHALFYLATGTHHGFGDGRTLAELAGSARWAVVAPASVLALVGGFAVAALLSRWAADRVGARGPATSMALITIAALGAAAGHGALTFTERAVRAEDNTYAAIMKHEGDRVADRLADERARQARGRGQPLSEAQLRALRARLRTEHQPFPLRAVLAVLLGAAVLAGTAVGCATGRRRHQSAPTWRQLLGPVAAGAASIVLVIAVGTFA